MPVSTERHSGFAVSKWELKYLRCRYLAHRNKIAHAKPAIDAAAPPERPHVQYKQKKALQEERRQMRIVQENLRVLNRTMNIMTTTSDTPAHFSKSRSATTHPSQYSTISSFTRSSSFSTATGTASEEKIASTSSITSGSTSSKTRTNKYFARPLTARLKRNTHIIFRWFIQRFGKYVPWWAEINY